MLMPFSFLESHALDLSRRELLQLCDGLFYKDQAASKRLHGLVRTKASLQNSVEWRPTWFMLLFTFLRGNLEAFPKPKVLPVWLKPGGTPLFIFSSSLAIFEKHLDTRFVPFFFFHRPSKIRERAAPVRSFKLMCHLLGLKTCPRV